MDLTDAVTAHIPEPELGTEEADRFVVDSDRKAAWAARKMAGYQAEVDRLELLADEERQRVTDWLADASHGARQKVEWFEGLLLGYLHELAENPDTPKTYKVPGAELKRRKKPDRVIVVDGNEFVEWALEARRFDLVNASPALGAIKTELQPTVDGVEGETSVLIDPNSSEVAPGVVYEVGSTSYTVKLT